VSQVLFDGISYLSETAVCFPNARLDEAIEARPLPTMAQRYKVLFTLDECFFWLVAHGLDVEEPRAEASVVTFGRSLESIELTSFDQDLI
jgi:hypothetical protein